MTLSCQRDLFDLEKDKCFLNCAYMSPQMKSVTTIGEEWLNRKKRPYKLGLEDFFGPVQQLKRQFAQLVNIPDPQRVAIIPSVSYGLANVANNLNLKPKEEIILLEEQFPSNYYIWKKIADQYGAVLRIICPPKSSQHRGALWNHAVLAAINDSTRLIAMAHVHWADGTKFNLKAISAKAKTHDALLIVDGTQSVGALPFDIAEIQPDALICAGYKWMMGPYGLGVAYYGTAFDNGEPIEENWINRQKSEDFKNLVNYQAQYKTNANRYSVGEQSNFILVPMLVRAIQQLNTWKPQRISEYCESISKEAVNRLKAMGCQIESKEYRNSHLIGVRLPEYINMEKLKLLFEKENVYVSVRGNAIRVAPNVYNTKADFDLLVDCFDRAVF